MKIKTYQGGYDKNLSYLIWCDKTNHAAIVDPAVNPVPILEFIEISDLNLIKIFITHSHYDHIQYLHDIMFAFPNIQLCCHKESAALFNHDYVKSLEDNEVIMLGKILIIALHTPGHYFDSICFWLKNNNYIFTGDTMFVGRTGRTISKKSNIKDLYHSIYSILLKLPDMTKLLPGHHYGYTRSISIKNNKNISNFFQCNSLNDFKKVMKKFESKYNKK